MSRLTPEQDYKDGYISLFDHNGSAVGAALGLTFWNLAKECKEGYRKRIVETREFSGKVCLYRREFVRTHFRQAEKRLAQAREEGVTK